MRPVCSDCEKEMRPARNGVLVYHPIEKNGEPVDEDKKIDFTAHCDEYECPECGQKIVTGCGKRILSTTQRKRERNRETVRMAKERGTARRVLR